MTQKGKITNNSLTKLGRNYIELAHSTYIYNVKNAKMQIDTQKSNIQKPNTLWVME